MNASLRIAFGVIALLFFSYLIVHLVLWGKPENSLHQSALSWSFLADVSILAAFGFSAIIDLIPYVFTKK